MFKNLPFEITARASTVPYTFPVQIQTLWDDFTVWPDANIYIENNDGFFFFTKPQLRDAFVGVDDPELLHDIQGYYIANSNGLQEHIPSSFQWLSERYLRNILKTNFEDAGFVESGVKYYPLHDDIKQMHRKSYVYLDARLERADRIGRAYLGEKYDEDLKQKPSIKDILDLETRSRIKFADNSYLKDEDIVHSLEQRCAYRLSDSRIKPRIVITSKYAIPYFLWLDDETQYEYFSQKLDEAGFKEYV